MKGMGFSDIHAYQCDVTDTQHAPPCWPRHRQKWAQWTYW
jgi:hypothetical protein